MRSRLKLWVYQASWISDSRSDEKGEWCDPSDDPVDISAARQLFLDDHVIAERENVTREVAQVRKYSGNPILTANRPWDQHPVLYGSVILDPLEGYRMWYFTWDKRGGLHKFGHRYADRGFVGYARSDDGRSWEKPELDIVKYEGQRTNCVIGPKDIPHLTEFTTELLDTSGGIGEWDRFNTSVASHPVILEDEIRFYYAGRKQRHSPYFGNDSGPQETAIGLASVPRDRFVSCAASFDGGVIFTKPITGFGSRLH